MNIFRKYVSGDSVELVWKQNSWNEELMICGAFRKNLHVFMFKMNVPSSISAQKWKQGFLEMSEKETNELCTQFKSSGVVLSGCSEHFGSVWRCSCRGSGWAFTLALCRLRAVGRWTLMSWALTRFSLRTHLCCTRRSQTALQLGSCSDVPCWLWGLFKSRPRVTEPFTSFYAGLTLQLIWTDTSVKSTPELKTSFS